MLFDNSEDPMALMQKQQFPAVQRNRNTGSNQSSNMNSVKKPERIPGPTNSRKENMSSGQGDVDRHQQPYSQNTSKRSNHQN